jgi:uncharacterized protein (TIGR02246 family)
MIKHASITIRRHSMNATLSTWLGILLAASLGAVDDTPRPGTTQAAATAPSDDEKAIRAMLGSFVESFAKGDAKAVAGTFTEGGEAVAADGTTIRGREALQAHYADKFATTPGDRIEGKIDEIHFLADGIARVDGQSRLIPADGSSAVPSRYSATVFKGDGGWRIASIREVHDEEPDHHARLEELAWLIGDWIEETGDAVITNSLAWSDDGNYLLRTFEVRAQGQPDLKGTQRIGWDPLTRQIKSWTFDSRGGYGEGHWVRSGDRWTVKNTGVRPDGLTTTATQVLTRVNKDRILWKSIDRTLGGEPAHDIEEIVMVRKPPEPK